MNNENGYDADNRENDDDDALLKPVCKVSHDTGGITSVA